MTNKMKIIMGLLLITTASLAGNYNNITSYLFPVKQKEPCYYEGMEGKTFVWRTEIEGGTAFKGKFLKINCDGSMVMELYADSGKDGKIFSKSSRKSILGFELVEFETPVTEFKVSPLVTKEN